MLSHFEIVSCYFEILTHYFPTLSCSFEILSHYFDILRNSTAQYQCSRSSSVSLSNPTRFRIFGKWGSVINATPLINQSRSALYPLLNGRVQFDEQRLETFSSDTDQMLAASPASLQMKRRQTANNLSCVHYEIICLQ